MKDIDCWEKKFINCAYSDRVLAKLLRLNEKTKNKIDIQEVKKAIYYAKKYHGNQKRQSGEPYYSHPLQVAFMIADYCFKTNILITSALHDTIEDTALNKEMIEQIFNLKIAQQVESLTRIKLDCNNIQNKISAADTLKSLWIHKQEELLLIKLFDRLHNIQTINVKSPEKIYKIIIETFKNFISLSIYLKIKIPDLSKIHQTIVDLCFQNSPTQQPQLPALIKFLNYDFHLPFLISQNEKFRNKIL